MVTDVNMVKTITPKQVENVQIVYRKLAELAKLDNEGQLVFEGSLVKAFDACEISRTYYKQVFSVLYESGCVTLMRRGGFEGGSVLVLHHEPSDDELTGNYLTYGPKSDTTVIDGRLAQLERQIGQVNVQRLLVSLDARFHAIEKRLDQLERYAKSTSENTDNA